MKAMQVDAKAMPQYIYQTQMVVTLFQVMITELVGDAPNEKLVLAHIQRRVTSTSINL